jgi:LDH2 family malate/lactate/ureidoglycolate dehydrogenase
VPVLSETSVTFDRLKAFIQQALIAVGLPEADAATVARHPLPAPTARSLRQWGG